ncbi:MAG: aminotransferase class I/II-fold pyridoxal phosphate-dependent enzyme [Pelolinea sp.]|jgi:8-amino-7-oxononanoate synthase|nr:aminotransferase class I/II-fold pyridoxal phosphate-dependent enzyme [Pelolinea sp.]
MDIFKKCREYTDAKEVMEKGIYPYFLPLAENEGTEVVYNGKRMIMCGSNNYLGLTTHPKVKEAAIKAVERFGTSCTGSRFLNGTLELHEQVEKEIADFVGKEEALIFSTGMQTNLGTISALISRDDVVILDKEDHASIVDGARLGYGKIERFPHNDIEHLERVLKSIPEDRGRLIVVDGVFSMGGDLADLPHLIPMARKYDARVMVDDAHGMGVVGGGRGTAREFGMDNDVDLIMSTFSKSFASLGGFIAGNSDIIHYIKHTARSLIFSASIPASNAAAVLAAIQVIRDEPERVTRVNIIGETIRTELRAMGFNIGNSVTPIVPVIIGDDELTFRSWKALFENGVFVNPVVSPAVSAGQQLLRTSYMATHTDEQIDKVLSVFQKVGKELAII